jgi:uncharacterized protein (DUF983 family)
MTEEERQKTILELEQQVFGSKIKKPKECEVCGNKLIKGECEDHPTHIRMHHQYLMRMRKQYEN